MPRHHPFEPHLEAARTWLDELSASLDLAPSEQPRALHALRAGLHAIRDRLPANEAIDLGAQLPTLIRGVYYEGWTLRNDPRLIRDRAAMIARVKRELAPDPRLIPTEALRAVIQLLVKHVSPGEIEDVLATLPSSIATLWQELAEPVADKRPPTPPRDQGLARRTGYSR